jgi:hypothetical protein
VLSRSPAPLFARSVELLVISLLRLLHGDSVSNDRRFPGCNVS